MFPSQKKMQQLRHQSQEKLYEKIDHLIPKVPKPKEKAILKLPNGKEIEIPILEDIYNHQFLDIRQLSTQTGIMTFDPGFTSTASCVSAITYIDGEKGKLFYRGYPIEELAEKCTYMEVSYLLLHGDLPSQKELQIFENLVVSEMMVHQQLINFYKGFTSQAHPMAILVGVVGALSAFVHEDLDIFDAKQREVAAIKLIAKMPILCAISYRTSMGLPIVYPQKKYNYVENFLYMMFQNPMEDFQISKTLIRAIDLILILHADHEQNASTSTVRIAASSLANPFACIAAGIASLWGPQHGGACEAVLNQLEEIAKVENIPLYLTKVKDKTNPFRLMGFGHRIYKNFDPRAQKMQEICHKLLKELDDQSQLPILELAKKLEETALSDEYFLKRKLYPNVDFYTGIVYNVIGIPKDMFTVMFALGRSIGWITQWQEMMNESVLKIGRPRQMYVGNQQRPVLNIEDREEEEASRVLPVPKLNKFTNLMWL